MRVITIISTIRPLRGAAAGCNDILIPGSLSRYPVLTMEGVDIILPP